VPISVSAVGGNGLTGGVAPVGGSGVSELLLTPFSVDVGSVFPVSLDDSAVVELQSSPSPPLLGVGGLSLDVVVTGTVTVFPVPGSSPGVVVSSGPVPTVLDSSVEAVEF